jgi:ParB family chromosome partitioning protein
MIHIWRDRWRVAGRREVTMAGAKGGARRRRAKAEPRSRGLAAAETAERIPEPLRDLAAAVAADGGTVLASYREPFAGTGVLLAALPLEQVEPTPFQRDASPAHVKRLAEVVEKTGRFLDPVIAVREGPGRYWCPNGNHRLQALKSLGARAITALVLPDRDVAFRILALNTEKAHALKEKSLEASRMEEALAGERPRAKEPDLAFEFENPIFLTLGLAYAEKPRFSGGAYRGILRRLESFLDVPLPQAREERRQRAATLLALDAAVDRAVEALKARGFRSPYLRPFVVSRIDFLRFVKGDPPPFGKAMERLRKSAERFDAGKFRQEDVTAAAALGPPEEVE